MADPRSVQTLAPAPKSELDEDILEYVIDLETQRSGISDESSNVSSNIHTDGDDNDDDGVFVSNVSSKITDDDKQSSFSSSSRSSSISVFSSEVFDEIKKETPEVAYVDGSFVFAPDDDNGDDIGQMSNEEQMDNAMSLPSDNVTYPNEDDSSVFLSPPSISSQSENPLSPTSELRQSFSFFNLVHQVPGTSTSSHRPPPLAQDPTIYSPKCRRSFSCPADQSDISSLSSTLPWKMEMDTSLPKYVRRRSAVSTSDSTTITSRIMSESIKEELRCKIQLRRINTGQEEIKVDLPPPGAQAFEEVKRKFEAKEKNRVGAKMSRDRARRNWRELVRKNEELKSERQQLLKEISTLRGDYQQMKEGVDQHKRGCSVRTPTDTPELSRKIPKIKAEHYVDIKGALMSIVQPVEASEITAHGKKYTIYLGSDLGHASTEPDEHPLASSLQGEALQLRHVATGSPIPPDSGGYVQSTSSIADPIIHLKQKSKISTLGYRSNPLEGSESQSASSSADEKAESAILFKSKQVRFSDEQGEKDSSQSISLKKSKKRRFLSLGRPKSS